MLYPKEMTRQYAEGWKQRMGQIQGNYNYQRETRRLSYRVAILFAASFLVYGLICSLAIQHPPYQKMALAQRVTKPNPKQQPKKPKSRIVDTFGNSISEKAQQLRSMLRSSKVSTIRKALAMIRETKTQTELVDTVVRGLLGHPSPQVRLYVVYTLKGQPQDHEEEALLKRRVRSQEANKSYAQPDFEISHS